MEQPVYHLKSVVQSRESLEDFEGPLDLILQLLQKKKIQIQDVRITDILEQYLGWMEEMQRLDLEIASEFIAMASYLLYIKSKLLVSSAQTEPVDEMELLIRSLEERERKQKSQRIQLAAAWLGQMDQHGLFMYPTPQDPPPKQRAYDLRHNPVDLLKAFDAILDRSVQRLPPSPDSFAGIAQAEPYPVTLKAAQLLRRLVQAQTVTMQALFADCSGRSELVAAFLALLELGRVGSVSFQTSEDEDIKVTFLRMPEGEIQ